MINEWQQSEAVGAATSMYLTECEDLYDLTFWFAVSGLPEQMTVYYRYCEESEDSVVLPENWTVC